MRMKLNKQTNYGLITFPIRIKRKALVLLRLPSEYARIDKTNTLPLFAPSRLLCLASPPPAGMPTRPAHGAPPPRDVAHSEACGQMCTRAPTRPPASSLSPSVLGRLSPSPPSLLALALLGAWPSYYVSPRSQIIFRLEAILFSA